MTVLQIKALYKKYSRKDAFALQNFSMEVQKGELLALIGESGSGKTTLLRLIAGFEEPQSGEIFINGKKVVGNKIFIAPEKRNVGMVFQDYALFPHLTIEENVKYGLNKWSKKERQERLDEMLRLVGLIAFKERYPHQLSGGQQQRVAMARALAPKPSLILMDEPFSNLDTVLKEQVREDIRRIIKTTGTTAIFVTHDTKDALSTADRISILKDGKIQQIGPPQQLFDAPENIYVANFFGKINVLNALSSPGGYNTPIGFLPCSLNVKTGEKVTLVIRPENIHICKENSSPLYGKVKSVLYLGDQKQVTLSIENNSQPYKLLLKIEKDTELEKGDMVHFKVIQDKIQVLDTCWYPESTPLTSH